MSFEDFALRFYAEQPTIEKLDHALARYLCGGFDRVTMNKREAFERVANDVTKRLITAGKLRKWKKGYKITKAGEIALKEMAYEEVFVLSPKGREIARRLQI